MNTCTFTPSTRRGCRYTLSTRCGGAGAPCGIFGNFAYPNSIRLPGRVGTFHPFCDA